MNLKFGKTIPLLHFHNGLIMNDNLLYN